MADVGRDLPAEGEGWHFRSGRSRVSSRALGRRTVQNPGEAALAEFILKGDGSVGWLNMA